MANSVVYLSKAVFSIYDPDVILSLRSSLDRARQEACEYIAADGHQNQRVTITPLEIDGPAGDGLNEPKGDEIALHFDGASGRTYFTINGVEMAR